MDLIRIRCETCQSWLKVRGEGFLGEVHACPKCGGMVLIAAPSAEPTETRADAPDNGPPPMLGMGNTLEEIETATANAVPPVESSAEVAIQSDAIDRDPIEEPAEPVSAAVTNWAPIATTAVSLMATGAILAAWWGSGSEPTVAVADPIEAIQNESHVEPAEIEAPVVENDPIGQSDEPKKNVDPDEPFVEPIGEPVEPKFDLPPAPEAAEPTPDPIDEPLAELIAVPEPEPDVAYENAPSVIDPLSLDPSEIELVLRRGPSEATDQLEKEDATEPSPDDHPVDPTEPTLDERLAAAAKQAGIYVKRGPTDATTGPPTGAAETRLTQVVPSIALLDVPLNEGLRLLGKLAGTPITIDPLALQRAGVRPTRPIDLLGEEQTIGDLLVEALGKSRLTYKTDGAFVTVVRKGTDRQREITHRLADLAGDQPDELTNLLSRLLATDQTLTVDPAGQLKLDAPMGLHYDLLVLCERLRAERGLPTESKYPRDLLSSTPDDELSSLLERRTTFSFVEPTPLAGIFDHWRRVAKRPFMVDWQSLGDAGIGPRTTIVCSVTNRPLRAALTGVLEPLGLAWTPAIGGSIWITTADRVQLRIPTSLSPLPAEQASRD